MLFWQKSRGLLSLRCSGGEWPSWASPGQPCTPGQPSHASAFRDRYSEVSFLELDKFLEDVR